MNTSILKAVAALVVTVAIIGGYFYPKFPHLAAASPAGSTFGSAKVAEVSMAPITAAATSSSILNTDANARIVDSGFVSCSTSTGAVLGASGGVASWTWQMATTTTANLGLQGNTNYAMNMTVATSATDWSYAASSTPTALVTNRFWASGTYLTINTNATTTNNLTETCQAGVYYHAS